MSLLTRRIIMIVAAVCCTCLAAVGFVGAMSSLIGAFGWVAAGIFALIEIQYTSLEQKVIAEAAAEIERMKNDKS